MKTVLLLLLFIGAFLVMDGAHRDSLSAAVSAAEARGRGATRYKVADGGDILDLQFAPRANQFGSLFDSNGPWSYRGSTEPFHGVAGTERMEDGSATASASASGGVSANDSKSKPKHKFKSKSKSKTKPGSSEDWSDRGAGFTRTGTRGKWYGETYETPPAVEGFSGAGGGRPTFIDGLGDPSHAPGVRGR
jgi:hypothetical protein